MHNNAFSHMTLAEKSKRLEALLYQWCQGELTKQQIAALVSKLNVRCQYDIKVLRKPTMYKQALVLSHIDGHRDTGRVLMGRAKFGRYTEKGLTEAMVDWSKPVVAEIEYHAPGCQWAPVTRLLRIYLPFKRGGCRYAKKNRAA